MAKTTPPALKVRHAKPEDLNPHPDNPNEMTPQAFEKLKAGMAEFGLVEPLVYNTRFSRLVGGHHRRLAAIELGWTRVPVTDVDLDEDRERALNVALNNQELQGTFNPGRLVEFLAPIADRPTLELSGFDFDQWQRIQADVADERMRAGREGAVPPPTPEGEPTRTSRGDTWRLGRHLLHVGDATTADAYQAMPAYARLCFTDPPYGVDYTGKTGEALEIENDAMADPDYQKFLAAAFDLIAANLRGAIYCAYATSRTRPVLAAWDAAGFHTSSTIAWVKDRFVLGRSDYHWQWEPILYGWHRKHNDRAWNAGRTAANVWEHKTPKRNDQGSRGPSNVWRYARPSASRQHPTMKPVTLVEHAVRNSSDPGDWILDPFAGSGSTLAAAENLGRNTYAVEYDPRYADVIIARWESLAADPTDLEKLG